MTSKVRIGLEILAGIVALVFLGAYIVSREQGIRMDATISAQKQVIDAAQKVITNAEADRAQHAKEDAARDLATTATLQSMQQALASLKTPQQQAGWSQAQLEQAIKGITITVDSKGQATAIIPAASLSDLPKVIEQCKECAVKLDKAQTDLTSRMQQQADADKVIEGLKIQNGGLEKDLKAAQDAAKGGTWIKRGLKTLKVAGCSAGGGYLGATQNKTSAAIGALAGAVVCSLI